MRKIFVTGATGKTGKRVMKRLFDEGLPTFAGSRRGSPLFDWDKPETWKACLQEARAVYITYQPDLAVPQALETIRYFVQQAREAGVEQLVLLSGRGEPAAQLCEDAVLSSGLSCSIVRASFFMQNFSEGFWAESILAGAFTIPEISAKEPFVAADDIADVVVEIIRNKDHEGKIYELTGPELLSFGDVIAKISAALHHEISLVELPLAEYIGLLKTYAVPDDTIGLLQYLFEEVLDGRNEFITGDIEQVLGRKPTTFDTYIHNALRSGAWSPLRTTEKVD